MARSSYSPFLLGLGLGTAVAIGVGVLYANMPDPEPSRDDVIADLLRQLDAGKPRIPRALPASARSRACTMSEELATAMRGTVEQVQGPGNDTPPPPSGTYDFPTYEARINAMLDATSCREIGKLEGVNMTNLADLGRSNPMIARRAFIAGDRIAARAWGLRTWALGQDLLAADVGEHLVVSHDLAAAGAGSLAQWMAEPSVTPEERADSKLVMKALLDRAVPPRVVVERRATRMLRRGLTSPVVENVDAAQLQGAFDLAAGWWAQVADAIEGPGQDIPAPPPFDRSLGRDAQDVFQTMLDPEVQEWTNAVRRAARSRLAARLMSAVQHGEGGCPEPWTGEPPLDPLGGTPADWNTADCALTLGDARWSPAPEAAQAEAPVPE